MKTNYFLITLSIVALGFIAPCNSLGQEAKASVTISNSDNIYKFNSKFDKTKTRRVQQYMTESLKGTDFKFTNTQLDAQLALNGGINFYIRSHDGELVMEFDKRKNKAEDFEKFKQMCEGLRDIIQKD